MHGVFLVLHWRGGAGEIVYHGQSVQGQGLCYVMLHEFEVGKLHQMPDVSLAACAEVVHADDVASLTHKAVAEMRAYESSAAGHQYARFHICNCMEFV